MTDTPMEDVDPLQQEREAEQDDLLDEQEAKGDGEDERDNAPPE